MQRLTLSTLLLAFAATALAADPPTTIELKDGGKIMIAEDKSMTHVDAAGKRVRMKDGKIMEAKDGSKLMMKSNAIWKTIIEKGTLNPNR